MTLTDGQLSGTGNAYRYYYYVTLTDGQLIGPGNAYRYCQWPQWQSATGSPQVHIRIVRRLSLKPLAAVTGPGTVTVPLHTGTVRYNFATELPVPYST